MFVRVTSCVLYFIPFFHCDLHNPSNISPIHTTIHSILYFLFIQVLFSLQHDIYRNPMFNLHAYQTHCFVVTLSSFHESNITNNRFLSSFYAHPNPIQVLLFQWLCSLSPISWNVVVYHSFTTDDNSPIIGMLLVLIELLNTIIHSSFINRFLSLSYSHRCNNQYLINDCVCPTFQYSK